MIKIQKNSFSRLPNNKLNVKSLISFVIQKKIDFSKIEKSISFSKINWAKNINQTTAIDAYATSKHLFNGLTFNIFIDTLKNAILSSQFEFFSTKSFDKKVSNHFNLTRIFYLNISFINRLDSIKFSLTAKNISPVIIGQFLIGQVEKKVLLDGNHRSISAALSNSKIRALILDFRNYDIRACH